MYVCICVFVDVYSYVDVYVVEPCAYVDVSLSTCLIRVYGAFDYLTCNAWYDRYGV